MMQNTLVAAVRRGPTFGAWLMLPGVAAARLVSDAGFDWLLVDTEHGAIGQEMMAEMVAAVAATGAVPLVRVTAGTPELIKRALDAGAWGIIVPMVNSVAEAEAVVRAAKFPPLGERGYGSPFARLPFRATTPDYIAQANANTLVVVQIETRRAVESVEAIAAVPGLDVLFVGPNDLSASYGLPPTSESDTPEYLDALARIRAAAQAHSLGVGIFANDGAMAARRAAEGYTMISASTDFVALLDGATRQLAAARAAS